MKELRGPAASGSSRGAAMVGAGAPVSPESGAIMFIPSFGMLPGSDEVPALLAAGARLQAASASRRTAAAAFDR